MRYRYPNPALKRERDPSLVKLFRQRGTITDIAAELGVSRQAVSKWRRCPPQYAKQVAALLDIPEHKLKPKGA